MTITVRYIEGAKELEARWAEIWLLLDAGHQFHADLLNKDLRPGREERSYASFLSHLQRGDCWFQVAEQDGEIVAVGSATILPKGRTYSGPVGEISNLYLHESVRGQGLARRMFEARVVTMGQQGVTLLEFANSAYNARIFEVHGSDTWGCTLRRPVRDTVPAPPMPVSRVKNLDEAWGGIWRLLQPSAKGTEVEARARAEAALAKRGAVFVAGQEPAGVIIGRISVNPWIFAERIGVVTDLEVEDGAEKDLFDVLLGRMEQWMISKRASDIETLPIRHGEYQAWNDRGFQPYFFWRQERV